MFEIEPWPSGPFDPAALRPLPEPPGIESLIVDHLATLASARDGLARVATDVATDRPIDVDAAYAMTIGAARDDLAAEEATASSAPLAPLVDAGDSADTIRQGVLRHLPQPDAPIVASFSDPPVPPGGHFHDGGPGPGPGPAFVPPPPPGTPPVPGTPPPLTHDQNREAIRQMYLSVLEREPDEDGWNYWLFELEHHGRTIAWVHDQLVGSEEYQSLHSG